MGICTELVAKQDQDLDDETKEDLEKTDWRPNLTLGPKFQASCCILSLMIPKPCSDSKKGVVSSQKSDAAIVICDLWPSLRRIVRQIEYWRSQDGAVCHASQTVRISEGTMLRFYQV